MSVETEIDWTDSTWNVTRGCSRKSPGCGGAKGVGGCYAEKTAGRFSGPGMPYEGLVTLGKQGARWTGKVILVRDKLTLPLHWRRPRKIFVNSMSDLFHEALPDEDIDQVMGIIAASQWRGNAGGDAFAWHIYQVLTKRADRMRAYMQQDRRKKWAEVAVRHWGGKNPDALYDSIAMMNGPMPRLWLGVSAENQEEADRRIPYLAEIEAAVRFVSVEPQLENVRLRNYLGPRLNHGRHPVFGAGGPLITGGVDWVICGAESGAGARPFKPEWASALRSECEEFEVPFFYKQDATPKGKKIRKPTIDGKVYQQFPKGCEHTMAAA